MNIKGVGPTCTNTKFMQTLIDQIGVFTKAKCIYYLNFTNHCVNAVMQQRPLQTTGLISRKC